MADDAPMPLHNLLIHVTGYADRGCAACDWLRERGHIPAVPPEVPRDRAPANYAEQRALLDDSLRDIPPFSPGSPTGVES